MGVLKNKPGARAPRASAKSKTTAAPVSVKPAAADIEALTDEVARTYPKILARLGE